MLIPASPNPVAGVIILTISVTNLMAIGALIFRLGKQMQRLNAISDAISKLDDIENTVTAHKDAIKILQERVGELLRAREAELQFSRLDSDVLRLTEQLAELNSYVHAAKHSYANLIHPFMGIPDRLLALEDRLDTIQSVVQAAFITKKSQGGDA